jgi:hypothetical protein
LKIPPADLTADHIYAHTDGDLFWWISNGFGDAMPGFAQILDERARWDLIDFIHANADARRVTGFIDDPATASIRAPNFMSECADGSTLALQDLRGRIVHIMLAGSLSAPRLQQLAELDLGGDVSTLVLAHDMPAAISAPFCTSRAPEAIEAYALYRGVRGAKADGTEFLVDAAGRLRAVWYPDFGSDWTNPEDLKADIEEIRRTDSTAPSPNPHVHVH